MRARVRMRVFIFRRLVYYPSGLYQHVPLLVRCVVVLEDAPDYFLVLVNKIDVLCSVIRGGRIITYVFVPVYLPTAPAFYQRQRQLLVFVRLPQSALVDYLHQPFGLGAVSRPHHRKRHYVHQRVDYVSGLSTVCSLYLRFRTRYRPEIVLLISHVERLIVEIDYVRSRVKVQQLVPVSVIPHVVLPQLHLRYRFAVVDERQPV